MANKMTYVSVIEDVLNGVELTAEHIAKLEAMKASYEKRNASKSGKPTKAQQANAAIGEAVVAAMESGVQYDGAAIRALVPELADATPQKIAPLMKKLVEAGSVSVSKVKGKNFYSLAE